MTADCLLDANVLVYALSNAPAEKSKKSRALDLIAQADFGLSVQVLQEFYVTVTAKFKQPVPAEKALEFIRSLAEFPLIPVDLKLLESGASLSQRYKISYWDGAVLAAAERLTAKILYSEDLNDGQIYGTVKVINPFQN